ncbi:hypothetical protein Rhopal_007427-T1 [Rhodotorula paludigena]|uniref:Large ribosomal subunit protein uL29m n=1 Tax=Rhodotorula paludigena TaxID=86838 RepID=A0AAV5GVU1_9BASI|nr:hypothetical protein Rhopal_007427-T1 [Rhodotorula paludigena]
MQRPSAALSSLARTCTPRAPAPLASLAAAPSPLRLFSSSSASPARSTAHRPKRDPTTYGLPPRIPRKHWPKQGETDTSAHPLWRFFHDQQSLEVPDKRHDYSSRSWTAPELRALPFNSLHELWYVLLRERNVLLTQREEARRLRVDLSGFTAVPEKLRMCQKSMARIKAILAERKHAALEAAAILRQRGDFAGAQQIEQATRLEESLQ